MSNRYTFETPEQVHRYAMFVEGNPFLKDGRTYVEKDEDGNYISSFVSQYSNIIKDNLEPGVKEAVLKLNEKGYLTFTSCQGHDDSKYRYIGVLFNTVEQKRQFISEVDNLWCDIHWYDNIINSVERPAKPNKSKGNITIHIVWDDQDYNDTTQAERRNKTYTDLELTKFWNVQTL